MRNIANFKNFIDIGEKVFEHLDFKTILNCKLVCQSWNQITTNPIFWLKKLKKMGQSSEMSKKWINLISKSKELEVSTKQITKALIIMHKRVTELLNDCYFGYDFERSIDKVILMQLPIVSAAILDLMDVMEVLAQMGENFDQIYFDECTLSSCYERKLNLPLIFAFEARNFKMVDFILSKMSSPSLRVGDIFDEGVFHCAVEHGQLDLVKRMTPMLNYVNEPWHGITAAWFAILHNQIEVLKYLTPLFNQNDIKGGIAFAMDYESIDAVKVLLPQANDQTMKSVYESEISTNKEIWNIITEELKRRTIKNFDFAP